MVCIEEKRLEGVREERATKKQKLADEAAEMEHEYEMCVDKRDCDGVCKCGPLCRMGKFVRCPVCKALKKGKCRVRKCVDAAAPLLLGMNTPTLLLTEE